MESAVRMLGPPRLICPGGEAEIAFKLLRQLAGGTEEQAFNSGKAQLSDAFSGVPNVVAVPVVAERHACAIDARAFGVVTHENCCISDVEMRHEQGLTSELSGRCRDEPHVTAATPQRSA